MTPPTPAVDAEQAREIRALFAKLRTPTYGDAAHQPRLWFHSHKSSRVVCTCGVELGIVTVEQGLGVVKDMYAEHVAALAATS